jgi:hypothetical protein
MDQTEIDEYLASRWTGVLALGRDDDGYAIPVSYVYDEDGRDVYFRLGYRPNSQKRAFVEASDAVSFVVTDASDGRWKSVVARGRLEELAESTLDSAVLEAMQGLDIPFVTIFEDEADLDFHVTRLHVTELDGRREVRADD